VPAGRGGDPGSTSDRRRLVAAVCVAVVMGAAGSALVGVGVFRNSSKATDVNVSASGARPARPTHGAPAGEGSSTTLSPPPSTSVGNSGMTGFGSTVVGSPTSVPAIPPVPAATVPMAPTTSTVPSGSGATTLTVADSGRRLNLRRGDRLVVNLTGSAIYTWTEPTSSDGVVLPRSVASPGATASATFVAAADGESTVSATANPNCYPQCLPPSRLFQVTISISG
jgi:hypothetical protein